MIKKCDNCEEEYEMTPGSNVCPKCGERTFVPAEEREIIGQKTHFLYHKRDKRF